DIVAIRIEDERPRVACVVLRPEPRTSVVAPTGLEGSPMEPSYRLRVLRCEGHVQPGRRRSLLDPAGWLAAAAEAGSGDGVFEQQAVAEGSEGGSIKLLASFVVAGSKAQVVDHRASPGGCLANHSTMLDMSASKPPGIEMLNTPARASLRFSKSWVR